MRRGSLGASNRAEDTTHIRRTKLVCTIGPATAGRVSDLVAAGMDVARVNFAHGTAASWRTAADAVRRAATDTGRSVALLTDLAGPKIRLGAIAGDEVLLSSGERFVLRPGSPSVGDASGAAVSYGGLGQDVRPGDRVLLADGAAELRVTRVRPRGVETEIVRGGVVRSRAGVAVPAGQISTPALTAKDLSDLAHVSDLAADFVALSFVRSGADVRGLREHLGPSPRIVAKIETRPAVDAFDAILERADAVMIARGDLGVEIPYEEVPLVQKQLLRRALDRGVPTIVATQMLESMISAPRPTRAEASDVANAVFDGADAVMLSGETAIGAHPILAAEAAVRIAEFCERRGASLLAEGANRVASGDAEALAVAAVALASSHADVAAIACYTRTGRTARVLSALRPPVPIVAFSPDERVVRALALVHGVSPRIAPAPGDRALGQEAGAGRLRLVAGLVEETGIARPGSAVVLVASSVEPGSGPSLVEVHRLL